MRRVVYPRAARIGATHTGTARRAVSAWANSSCSGYTDDNEIRTLRTDTLMRPASLISRERIVSKRALASAVPLQTRAAQDSHEDAGESGEVQPQLIGAHRRRRSAIGEQPQLLLLYPVLHVATSAV